MNWQLSGRSMELCSCNMLCPCWLGSEGSPDQGWCGGALGFDIQRGSSDGVDLRGTKVAFTAEWPGNFFAGKGTARLYIADSANAEQHRDWRRRALRCGRCAMWAPATQYRMQVRADSGRTPRPDTGHVLQPAVVRSYFERLERVDVQFLVDALRETMTQAGHGGIQLHGIGRAAQPFELCPVAGAHHLHECRGDASSDAGQAIESFEALAIGDGHDCGLIESSY